MSALKRFRAASLVLALAALPLAACSPGGPGSQSKTDGGATGFQALLDAFCHAVVQCQTELSDLATCEAVLSSSSEDGLNELGAIQAAIAAGKVAVDASKYAACATAIQNLPCDTTFDGDFNALPGCAGLFTGTVSSGGSCIANEECEGSQLCFVNSSSSNPCAGTCIAAGSQCNQDSDCTGGGVCNSGTCAAPNPAAGGNGDPCGQDDTCQSGLVCLTEMSGTVCGSLSTSGGPCSDDDACAEGFVCTQTGGGTASCAPTPTQGESCTNTGVCASGLICVPSADLSTSTCLPPATLGQSCTTTFQCGGPYSLYYCSASTMKCVARPTAGPCPDSSFDLSCNWLTTYCDTSGSTPVCTPFKMSGAGCNSDDECGSTANGAGCNGPAVGTFMGSCTSPMACSP